jgi:hypothetical protein
MKYLVLIIVFIGCSKDVLKSKSNLDCMNFLSDIQKYWSVDTVKKGFYHTTDSFLNNVKTKYKYCLYNRSAKNLISILGPCIKTSFHDVLRNEIDSLHLSYSLIYEVCTESCSRGRSYGISSFALEFFIDKNDKIKLCRKETFQYTIVQ